MEKKIDKFELHSNDYTDCFAYVFHDPDDRIGVRDVAQLFADPGPRWLRALFALRNRIAGLCGLKADVASAEMPPVESRIGVFGIYDSTESRIVLGLDDKHLDFRVLLSLNSDQKTPGNKRCAVETQVKINNRLGRVYFFFVKPFHRMIVPTLLKRRLRQLGVKGVECRINGV